MGLFDIFTGDPAKDAAAKNTALLQANQTAGTNTLQGGQTSAISALDSAKGDFAPLASKYGAGSDMYLNSLGVNGPQGNAAATGAFQAGPGYQYAVDQSLQGINRAGAVGGQGLNGNTLAALSDRAGNMANQEYGSWQDKLGGLVSPELQATSGEASADASKAPVYTGTASNIANLGTNTTNAITGQNTQAANAEMQGSGNIWNLGLNLAKLGTGVLSGGTSLLGGPSGSINLGGPGGPTPFS